ncbi:hypothetical protein GGTG_08421 [Gaeumannomyces tritici R3-111a-1]|uniref:Uncharacterized protein n=1 Tax=Gaeumannomyces tritici (strain R3-111a-1) TaxID=644352 RepID=J3P4I4_GAET3|nr:hypothetical protein GGTG_08421 [Gaeumannomyces tritici R3-111a-1]EJT74581.1 hypothetical protein GGTG_08421 [Gaeumannomyces tritici R3-111a-1]
MLPLLKKYPDGYGHLLSQQLTAFPKDVGFNNGLPAPKPNCIEGLKTEQHRPLPVDAHVNGAVLYKKDAYSFTLPHLAGEWKGTGGNMRKAVLHITTLAANGENLYIYAHYAAPGEDGTLEYHQYRL